MNMKYVGEYIAKLRKEKGFTQSQLAGKIHVSDKTISKWENGKSIPDYTMLESLGKALGVSSLELLVGRNITEEEKEIVESSCNSMKYYQKQGNKKISKRYLILLLVVVIFFGILFSFSFFSSVFFFNNYNNFQIYALSSADSRFSLTGVLVNTPEKKVIVINNVTINDALNNDLGEIYAYEYRIYYGTLMMQMTGDISIISRDEYGELQSLNDAINDINIYILEDIDYLNEDFKDINGKPFELEVNYIDSYQEYESLIIPIQVEKISSNDKFSYRVRKRFRNELLSFFSRL